MISTVVKLFGSRIRPWATTSVPGAIIVSSMLCGNSWAADGPRSPQETAAALRVPEGLTLSLFAAEPLLTNPSNIAVDARGRVWVCDVVNYRRHNGERETGDRILILEDVDGDGQADKSTLFYEGRDIDSALGILPLADRVLVSCSPNVWMFFDDDGDDRADRHEPLFTKSGQPQHDHSAHAFVFGPDGKLYWNMGNTHDGVFDAAGHRVLDQRGRVVAPHGEPFRQGMAFRCNLDGTRFEVLAHNYRNSYELTVGPFGDVWFSDNDDDGNRSTRICYVLEGGNYGYTDEVTGKSWNSGSRTGIESEIPKRHWHANDPGSIPNVFDCGSGSPSGIMLYEGDLLGAERRGALIHCEPGHNEVRSYLPRIEQSGFAADQAILVDGKADPWFRPVDAAAAPDGSILVADWYDPGVGGHQQGDSGRGRIYRLSASGREEQGVSFDRTSVESCAAALDHSNDSVRREAWQALAAQGEAAYAALTTPWRSSDARRRARALWLLARLDDHADAVLDEALGDADENVRITALRASREAGAARMERSIDRLVNDPSPRVRAECAVELPRLAEAPAAALWARLARRHQAGDRWSIEALGIGADGRWDACWDAWRRLAVPGQEVERTEAGRDIVWRSRGTRTMETLVDLLADPATPQHDLLRLLRALDFNESEHREELLTRLAAAGARDGSERGTLLLSEAIGRWGDVELVEPRTDLLDQLLERIPRNGKFAGHVTRFRVANRYPQLIEYALADTTPDSEAAPLVDFLLGERRLAELQDVLKTPGPTRDRMVFLAADASHAAVVDLLWPVALSTEGDEGLRRAAIRTVATNRGGAERLVAAAEGGDLAEDAKTALVYALRATPFDALARRAAQVCDNLPQELERNLPVAEWMQIRGVPAKGKEVFLSQKANCSTCHRAHDIGPEEGRAIGPGLTEIGSKLSRTALFEAVLYPSAAISHNYETYMAITDQGTSVTGVLIDQNDQRVTIRTEKGVDHEFLRDELERWEKRPVSLMPSGVEQLLSPQELADLIAWLASLRKGGP